MNYSIYRFTLDIHRTKSQVSIPVLFHDTGIQFYISLTDGGKPYFIEDGCRAVFSAKKPDGATLFNDCIIEDNTRIRYDFTEQTTNCEGMMNCEIRLYGTDGNLITTPAFVVVVDPRVIYDDGIVESHSESTILDNIVSAEHSRLVGERTRIEAEQGRVDTEEGRVIAEIKRSAAENERVTAEGERDEAEKERLANERERVAAYAHMLGSWVAYSAYPDGTDYTFLWSEGQRYIGICNGKTPPQDKTGFVWSKFVDTGIYIGGGEMPTWCNLQIDPDGEVTEVVQECGQSTTNVMSQKATSNAFTNALKGSASGEMLALTDVSPITHEMGVKVTGKNLCDNVFEIGAINQTNGDNYNTSNQMRSVNYHVIKPNTVYTLSKCGTDVAVRFRFYDENKNYSGHKQSAFPIGEKIKTFTSADDAYYVRFDFASVAEGILLQLEEDATATAYAPYIEDVSAVTLLKRGKNVAKLQAYSAVSIYPPTNANNIVLTNNYGTTINTTEPGNIVEVTQILKSEDYADDPGSYQNGYVCIGLDRDLVVGGKYKLSFDVEIKSNPLSATFFRGVVNNYNYYEVGTQTTPYEVGNKYHAEILIKWIKREDRPTERNINIRCMGMSFILSNFMITAEGVDGDFEEYTEQEYPVNADGTVNGVAASYPITTLLTDTVGAVMDVTYNRDANKVVNELAARLAALEAAALN